MSEISFHLLLFTDSGKKYKLGTYHNRENLNTDIKLLIDDFKNHGYSVFKVNDDLYRLIKEIPSDVGLDEIKFELNVVMVVKP